MRTLTSFRFAAFLLTALLLITGSSLQAQATKPDATPIFTAIHMLSKTEGWAVVTTPNPRTDSYAVPGQIYPATLASLLHTSDGGLSWTDVTLAMPSGLPPQGVYGCDCSDNGLAGFFFLDNQHAWLMLNDVGLPQNQIFNGISVRATDTSGQSWQQSHQALGGPFVITSSFIDAQRGWLLVGGVPSIDGGSQPALLYRTSDGGMRWTLIADDGSQPHSDDRSGDVVAPISTLESGVTPKYHLEMKFESASSGWMLTTYYDPPGTDVLHTTDGGVSWSAIDRPEMLNDFCGLSQLKFGAPGELLLLASCYPTRMLIHSSDDGQSWQSTALPDNLFPYTDWPQLFMLNMTTGWALGCDSEIKPDNCDASAAPFLFKTVDGGATWRKIGALPEALTPATFEYGVQIVPKFDFVDDQTGWAIDASGELLSTHDSGKTWTALDLVIG